MPTKIPFDPGNPNVEAARRIFLAWLGNGGDRQLNQDGSVYDLYVEYIGNRDPGVLAFYVTEAFWQLLIEGVVAPGMNSSNMNLPWFHVTAHGKKVIESSEPDPQDPTGYVDRLRATVNSPDPTIVAYLAESLQCYRRSNHIASTILLGIAAERVFLLLCDSLVAAIVDPTEKAQLQQRLDRFPMKPKLDWVH